MRRFKVFVRVLILSCLLVSGGIIHPFSALGYRADDFRVNDSIPPSKLDQIFVATDYNGKIVVVWTDVSDFENRKVYLKQFRLDGNQGGNQIQAPDIFEQGQRLNPNDGSAALLPNGNIVLVRTMEKDSIDNYGNFYPLYRGYIYMLDSLGNPLNLPFMVDTLPASTHRFKQYFGGLAADRYGNFTVAFNTNNGIAGPDNEIFFQQFYSDGQKRGNLIKVQCDSVDSCDFAIQNRSLSMNRDGKFIISWDAYSPQSPFAAIYNTNGTILKGPFIISCDETLTQKCGDPSFHCLVASAPKVGIDSAGNFMSAFNVCTIDDPTGKQVFARLYDQQARPVTPNLDIDEMEYSYFYFHRPRAVATEDGQFVVVWVDKSLEGPYKPLADIWAKRFDSKGNQIGIKYRINNRVASVLSGEVFDAAITNGHLFVTWLDVRSRPGLYSSVYAQIMPVDEVGVFTPGDINYDYSVNLTDLIGIVNYVFKGAVPPEGSPLVCDVNGNCKVDIVDIIYLVNYLFKAGPKPQQGCAK